MKKKTNLDIIQNDINSLAHFGVKGMSWYSHQFGKWQPQAVYAGGQPDPNAKTSIGSKIKSKATKVKASMDAKNDYNLVAASRGNRDARKRNAIPQRIAVAALQAPVQAALATNWRGVRNKLGDTGTMAVTAGMIVAGSNAAKGVKQAQVNSYNSRHLKSDKDKYHLSSNEVLLQRLTPEYVAEYTKQMDTLLVQYGR